MTLVGGRRRLKHRLSGVVLSGNRFKRSGHRRTGRDGGARLHVVGSTNRNAQPLRAAGVFFGAASVRIPFRPVD